MENKIEDLVKKIIEEFGLDMKRKKEFCLEQAAYNLLENDAGNEGLAGYKIAGLFLDLEKEKIAENDLLKRISNYEFNDNKKDSEFEVGLAEMFLDDKGYFIFSKICQRISAVLDPGNAKSMHLLGRIKLKEAKYSKSEERKKDFIEEAAEYFNMAVKADPNFDGAYISLGDINLENHYFKEALSNYQKAYQLGNKSEKLLNNLALSYMANGNKIMFEMILSESLERFPEGNADYFLERGAKKPFDKYRIKKISELENRLDKELLEEIDWPKTKN